METLNLSFGSFAYKTTRYNNLASTERVLFIGGAFQSAANFHRIALEVSRYASFDVIELPGFGTTPIFDEQLGFDFFTEVLNDYCNLMKYERVYVTGVSYGSAIAWNFSAQSTRVESLVLLGCMKSIPDYQMPKIAASLLLAQEKRKHQLGELIVEMLLNLPHKEDIVNFKFVHRVLLGSLKNLPDQEIDRYILNTERLIHHELDLSSAPSCRTLCFVGEHDSFTKPDYCYETFKHLKSAEMHLLKQTDHIFHLEKPSVMPLVIASSLPSVRRQLMASGELLEVARREIEAAA